MPANSTGSWKSILLVSRSTCAGSITSVTERRLLPLSPPPGLSGVGVAMAAVLTTLRVGLPDWKLGDTTSVTDCVSPGARLPRLQV